MSWSAIDLQSLSLGPSQPNPFARAEFLATLEHTGCANTDTGWEPYHQGYEQTLWMPTYRKTHTYGEYVFDWAWADAYARMGFNYFPKLVSAIPFTPSVGPRLLGSATPAVRQTAIKSWQDRLPELCADAGASGWHLLFPEAELLSQFDEPEFILRQGCQFHWHNSGYRDFQDFLDRMTSRRRKTIRKERQRIQNSNLDIRFIAGHEMQPDWLETFMRCYQSTYHKRGMPGYLTPAFFAELLTQHAPFVHFCLAFRDEQVIAGALLFADNDTLYGRYWGALEAIDGLHFEVCYYQGIEFAIRQGLSRFDPGTQGEHKIPRGFAPIATWSVHWLAAREIHELVRQHVLQERQHVARYIADAETLLPYRQPT